MLAYRYRLRVSTEQQRRALAQHIGAARYAHNWGLARIRAGHEAYTAAKAAGEDTKGLIPDHFTLCREWTEFAGREGHKRDGMWWTSHIATSTIQGGLRNAVTAFKNWGDSHAGRRAGRKVGYPRFKSKRAARQSFPLFGGGRVTGARTIRLPKIGDVHTYESTKKLRRVLDAVSDCDACHATGTCSPCAGTGRVPCPAEHGGGAACKRCTGAYTVKCRDCKQARGARKPADGSGICGVCKGDRVAPAGRIVTMNVSRTPSGAWYVAIMCEVNREIRKRPTAAQQRGGRVGVDISTIGLTLSTGDTLTHPRGLDALAGRLRRADQVLARRTRRDDDGHVILSRRRERARLRRARLTERVANIRRDWGDQAATALIHGVRPGCQHEQLRGLRGHATIVVEGYDLQVLAQHAANDTTVPVRVRRARNRGMTDLSAGEIRTRLALRSTLYGTEVIQTSKTAATGRTCSRCGAVRTKPVNPQDAEFRCDACGYRGDRRLNTAAALARGHIVQSDPSSGGDSKPARGDPVRPAAPRPSGRSRGHGSSKRVARSGIATGQPQSAPRGPAPQGNGAAGTPGGQPPGVRAHPPPEQPGLW